LTQLLRRQDLREEMGSEGRRRVEALYDWPVVIGQWTALWGELSAIARGIEHKKPDRLDFLQANHFAHFGHYASRIVSGATPVRLTPRGKETLAGKRPLYLHPWAQGFLQPEPMRACLCSLKAATLMRAAVPVGQLLEVVQQAGGMAPTRALMHIMWLAKYDLVSFEGPVPKDATARRADTEPAAGRVEAPLDRHAPDRRC
jgi:hypothetical protein